MKKKIIEALNEKAKAIERLAEGEAKTAEAQGKLPGMPQGCTTIFDTGWETNPRPTYPIGNCQASARDFHGCAGDCWWPAQVPDGLVNHHGFRRRLPERRARLAQPQVRLGERHAMAAASSCWSLSARCAPARRRAPRRATGSTTWATRSSR